MTITDLDRIANADNVDGEGPLFDLAKKRTATFLSRGMCLADKSLADVRAAIVAELAEADVHTSTVPPAPAATAQSGTTASIWSAYRAQSNRK